MTTKPQKKFDKNIFTSSKLIIAEGEDDAHFIFKFLKHLDRSLTEKIQIHWVGGNTKLFEGHVSKDYPERNLLGLEMMLTAEQNFLDNVENIAVIFDAEVSASDSFENIINQCEKANKVAKEKSENSARVKTLNLPTEVGQLASQNPESMTANLSVFLFDIGDGTGALEDLYLSTLEDEEKALIQDCVGKMIRCAEEKGEKIDYKKVKTQSFLAIKDPTLKSIGFAATKDKINFERGLKIEDSPLNSLKTFLLDFSKL